MGNKFENLIKKIQHEIIKVRGTGSFVNSCDVEEVCEIVEREILSFNLNNKEKTNEGLLKNIQTIKDWYNREYEKDSDNRKYYLLEDVITILSRSYIGKTEATWEDFHTASLEFMKDNNIEIK